MSPELPMLAFIRSATIALIAAGSPTLHGETVAAFDINDADNPALTLPGWTEVRGATNDADAVTGTDGTHTLTLSTNADGQDRERNAGSFPAEAEMWRDFWFVDGNSAVATLTGLDPDADYVVEIWAYDLWSTPMRAATWTDAVTGNQATLEFDGGDPGSDPVPASLADSVAVVPARSDGSGVVTLLAASSGGLPGIYVSGLRVSDGAGSALLQIEAESAILGSAFETISLDGATAIGATSTVTAQDAPGDPQRVARYSVNFPAAGSYHLYARLRVGAGGFNDDSLFYANSFGVKSPDNAADWVFRNGLADGGYTGDFEVVDSGGSAGNEVWKWVRLDGPFTVPDGGLAQVYEIAGREDGLYFDRFVFAPETLSLTVSELENGVVEQAVTFDGPDGIAIHRFGEPNGGRTPDGAHPLSALTVVEGDLVGSTLLGGNTGDGVAFRVSPDGESFSALASFIGAVGGAHPKGGFLVDGGSLIGVTASGGASGAGAVFERADDGTFTLLHSFTALDEHTAESQGGSIPHGPLETDGTKLFGAASAGGSYSSGTLFSLSRGGGDFELLHEFSDTASADGTNADGSEPRGGLVLADGRLFGTTAAGGSGGSGVVFSALPDGNDFEVLHHFAALDPLTGANLGGAIPNGGLRVEDGMIFGTTLVGGAEGNGSIFALRSDGSEFTELHAFPQLSDTGSNADGARPAAGLILSGNVLYGVASSGGRGGAGTVFAFDIELNEFRTLHHFEAIAEDGTNRFGGHPVAPVLRLGPDLFGTTFGGGPGRTGTVFRLPIPISSWIEGDANADGTIDATFVGRVAPGQPYRIQGSNDLVRWDELVSGPADPSGFLMLTEESLGEPSRFYRLAEP